MLIMCNLLERKQTTTAFNSLTSKKPSVPASPILNNLGDSPQKTSALNALEMP